MGTLTALALATPIFGFSLAPPDLPALSQAALPAAQVQAAVSLEASAEAAESAGPSAAPTDQAAYVVQLRKRAKIAKIHRTLGIATWATTTLAVIAGTIQYRNLYGAPFATELGDTPCVQGKAWPNQEQCYGKPLLHAVPGFVAGGLYFTTMGLAWAMPDPDNASKGDSKFAKNIRTHKLLRWVHLTGMLTQMVLGIVIANPAIGLDRSEDYDKLKKLAGVHLASGYITLGALTWAGTIMLL
jgi:hypothetical protein